VPSEKYEKAKERALEGYLDPGPDHLNCAQAVMRCGLLAMDQDPGLTYYASFLGGGMARMGLVCGALSGAALTLGLHEHLRAERGATGTEPSFDWLQALVHDFEDKFGSSACKGLLGCDISTAQGFRQAKRTQATKNCPEFVTYVCDRLAEVVDRPQ